MMAEFFSETHNRYLNQHVAEFVSTRIWGAPDRFDRYCTMGVFDDDGMVAGVVYHNYHPDEGIVEVSAGANTRRWLTKDILRKFISMPFDRLGCQAIVARHPETAKHLRRMWVSGGADEYIIPRLRGRDAPAEVVTVLTEEAWNASHYMKAVQDKGMI